MAEEYQGEVHVWMVWRDAPLKAEDQKDRLGQYYTAYLFAKTGEAPRMPVGYTRIKKHGIAPSPDKLNPMLNPARALYSAGAKLIERSGGPNRAARRQK